MDTLKLLGRSNSLFKADIATYDEIISRKIEGSRVLVVGAGGTIGQALTKEIFVRNPKLLHAVDVSENNLVELVREIRSTAGYISGEFGTFVIDALSDDFDKFFISNLGYDYVFNFAALKHVRSEKDVFSLLRMVKVNIFLSFKLKALCNSHGVRKYFCVSTDKAANPVNMMGASKRIMEKFIFSDVNDESTSCSMARFANVAFSDGSLLHGFNQRFLKRQPFSAPYDIRRYFISKPESGELCLFSGFLGTDRDIFYPKLECGLDLISFSDLAIEYLRLKGKKAVIVETEDEARNYFEKYDDDTNWPCYFFSSDTEGEKSHEEFYTLSEELDTTSFETVGIVKTEFDTDKKDIFKFIQFFEEFEKNDFWDKELIIKKFNDFLPNFKHSRTGKFLDEKM